MNQKPIPKTTSPLVSPAMKRKNRPGAITPSGNTRLNAYISTPPPKLSPPLRSSRPRQPVSAATTISSRVKAIERDKSPSKRDNKSNTRGNEPATRRRKISMGPIDYESRREQIKLSYTKSLRETEARVATRKAAQERKRKEEEAKALAAQAAAAEVLKSQEDVQTEGIDADTQSSVDANASVDPSTVRSTIPEPLIENPPHVEGPPPLDFLPLQTVATDLQHTEIPIALGNIGQAQTDSPTLFIPGSFPSAESPGYQDEAPPSAISNTTEFDAEPQTDPPVQESPVLHDDNQDRSGIDENTQPSYRKSEYRSPFEDEPVADDSLSIKIALDTSTDSAITLGELPMPKDDISTIQEVPVTYQEDGYDSIPPQSPSYETKVTILGRDADFTPPVVEIQDPGFSAPVQEQQDAETNVEADRLYTSSLVFPDKNPNQSDVEQIEPSSGLSEIAEFFVGPLLKHHQERLQTSTATQEVTGAEDDVEVGSVQQNSEDLRYSVDSKRTLGTRPSLTVPRTSESLNRASQTTVWTDYSVNSQDSSSGDGPIDPDSQRAAFTWREALADSESDSRSESYQYSRNSIAVSNSRDVSPCRTYREPELYEPQHQLPEIDTGEEFAAGILSRKNSMDLSAIPVLPSHSPPPPPDDVSFHDAMSSAPPSEYYDDTRPNSFLHIEKDDQSMVLMDPLKRDSDYFAPLESASRSIDQGSFTASEVLNLVPPIWQASRL